MDADSKKRIQITVIVFLVIAAARVGFMIYERRDTGTPPKKEPTYSSNQDDYVTTHKIVPYNVESAKKEMVGKPACEKSGNQLPYYPYDPATHSVNFKREAGLLPPVAKLQIEDVALQRQPVALKPGEVAVVRKQIMAAFTKAGSPAPNPGSIGLNTGDATTSTAHDVL